MYFANSPISAAGLWILKAIDRTLDERMYGRDEKNSTAALTIRLQEEKDADQVRRIAFALFIISLSFSMYTAPFFREMTSDIFVCPSFSFAQTRIDELKQQNKELEEQVLVKEQLHNQLKDKLKDIQESVQQTESSISDLQTATNMEPALKSWKFLSENISSIRLTFAHRRVLVRSPLIFFK